MEGSYRLPSNKDSSISFTMKVFSILLMILSLGSLPAEAGGGGLLYAVNTTLKRVGIYDPELLKRIGTIQAGEFPLSIAISPDGEWIAVGNHMSYQTGRLDAVWIIERRSGEVTRRIDIYRTHLRYQEKKGEAFLLFSTDGKKLYAVDSATRFLDVIRTSDWRFIKKVALGIYPMNPLLSPDGKRLYIPNLYSRDISIIDTERDEVVDSLKIDGTPSAVALGEDGKTLYITDMENHRVLFLDILSRSVTKEISVGTAPRNLILPDGRFLYVLNTYSNSLSIIDVITKEYVKTLGAAILPKRMAFDPSGKKLFVASEDAGIGVVDIVKQKPLTSIPTDGAAADIVFAPE